MADKDSGTPRVFLARHGLPGVLIACVGLDDRQ